jgi:hypothetical protein
MCRILKEETSSAHLRTADVAVYRFYYSGAFDCTCPDAGALEGSMLPSVHSYRFHRPEEGADSAGLLAEASDTSRRGVSAIHVLLYAQKDKLDANRPNSRRFSLRSLPRKFPERDQFTVP